MSEPVPNLTPLVARIAVPVVVAIALALAIAGIAIVAILLQDSNIECDG